MHTRPVHLFVAALVAAPFVLSCGTSPAAPVPSPAPPPPRAEFRLVQGGTEVAQGSTLSMLGVQVGGSRDVILTIRNPGAAPLALTEVPAVQLSGTDVDQFSVPVQPDPSLAASSETSFTLRFDPTTAGTKSATVTIASSVGAFAFTAQGPGRDSIWLFPSAAAHTGNLGGRAGADRICVDDYHALWDAQGCSTVHAFLTVDSADTIPALPAPAGHDVRTVADVRIETSWANLWDFDAITTGLGSITGPNHYWWSGCYSDCSPLSTCSGWSSASPSLAGTRGDFSTADAYSWFWYTAYPCAYQAYLVCVCW
jgi:hypothetical protein